MTAMGKILLKGYADTRYFPVVVAITMQSFSDIRALVLHRMSKLNS